MKSNTVVDENTNLVDVVTNMLTNAGHPRPSDWTRNLHKDAFEVKDLTVQRFLINRCMRMILGEVTTENTMDARYCLVDTGEIKDWIRVFEQGVLPCMIRNNLPPAMN